MIAVPVLTVIALSTVQLYDHQEVMDQAYSIQALMTRKARLALLVNALQIERGRSCNFLLTLTVAT